MHVKPRTGLAIVDPDMRNILPAEGRDVPDSGYWQRRIQDGDVINVSEPVASTSKTTDRSVKE